MNAIHWSGGLKVVSEVQIAHHLKGWPACCSGMQAYRIKHLGMMNGSDPKEVTCKRCQALLREAGKLQREVEGETMFKPLQDRIVVKQSDADEKVGSIIVPEEAKEKPLEGMVVAVGPGRVLDNGEHVTPSVKAGDVVLFTKYAGNEIEIEKETFLILHEPDILGIVHTAG